MQRQLGREQEANDEPKVKTRTLQKPKSAAPSRGDCALNFLPVSMINRGVKDLPPAWQQNVTAGTGAASSLSFSGNNNRIDEYSYDAAGNFTYDGAHHYYYDAENRLIQVDGTLGTCSTATACYFYDAVGRRVEKIVPSGTFYDLFDLSGHMTTEFDSAGGWSRGEVFAGGRHVATYANSKTYFSSIDALGTERVRVTQDGASANIDSCRNLPFADDWGCWGGAAWSVSPLHFTGKERDSESNLDYFGARYYSSSLGRFMTSDPAGLSSVRPADPQTLNRYAYVRNSPLNRVDPTGMEICDPETDVSACCDPSAQICDSGGGPGDPSNPGDPGNPGDPSNPGNPDNGCTPGDFSCNPFADNSCANPFSGTCSSPFGGPGPIGWGNGTIADDPCVISQYDNGTYTGSYTVNTTASQSQCKKMGGQWVTPGNTWYVDDYGNVKQSEVNCGRLGRGSAWLTAASVAFFAGAAVAAGSVAGAPAAPVLTALGWISAGMAADTGVMYATYCQGP